MCVCKFPPGARACVLCARAAAELLVEQQQGGDKQTQLKLHSRKVKVSPSYPWAPRPPRPPPGAAVALPKALPGLSQGRVGVACSCLCEGAVPPASRAGSCCCSEGRPTRPLGCVHCKYLLHKFTLLDPKQGVRSPKLRPRRPNVCPLGGWGGDLGRRQVCFCHSPLADACGLRKSQRDPGMREGTLPLSPEGL